MDISANFMVASEQGIHDLFFLKKIQCKDMYGSITDEQQLNQYIEEESDYVNAVKLLNNFNNQLIILYIKNEPAGFALIKQAPVYPDILAGKKTLNFSSFYIAQKHNIEEAAAVLWQKCMSLIKVADAVWMEVLQSNPLLTFFKNSGFQIHEESLMGPFNQPSYIIIRYKKDA